MPTSDFANSWSVVPVWFYTYPSVFLEVLSDIAAFASPLWSIRRIEVKEVICKGNLGRKAQNKQIEMHREKLKWEHKVKRAIRKHESKYSRLKTKLRDSGSDSDENWGLNWFIFPQRNYLEGTSAGVNHDKSWQGNEMHHPELPLKHCAQIKDLPMLW